MCGRYLLDDEAYADLLLYINSEFGIRSPDLSAKEQFAALDNIPGLPPAPAQSLATGEVFPTNIAPVITHDGAAAVKWGFPHYKNSSVIINARAETAPEKSMFRKPLRERRCVVPSCGFYEWDRTGTGKKKDKYLLRKPGERLLYMAGLTGVFRKTDGLEYSAFVILTTSANDSLAPIHDRMPVILSQEARDLWLSDDGFVSYALSRTGPDLVPDLCT